MLTYDLSGRGSLTRCDYLYRCIKEDILSGRLAAGEKLPSKRTLAAHLNIAVVTVENAYAQLEAEGYLNARERRGYFVNEVELRSRDREVSEPVEEEPEPRWLLDLRGTDVTGKELQNRLDEVYITANKNAVPNEPLSPFVTSGLRLGTPAVTTRGFGPAEMDQIAGWITDTIFDFEGRAESIRQGVTNLCARYPLYR